MIEATAQQPGFQIDFMLVIPLVLLGAMLLFMWRGNKKRQEQQTQMRSQMVVGADVMTQAGIYGTITEIDAEHNITTIETTPGTRMRVHSSTIVNILTPAVPDDASSLTAGAQDLERDDLARDDLDAVDPERDDLDAVDVEDGRDELDHPRVVDEIDPVDGEPVETDPLTDDVVARDDTATAPGSLDAGETPRRDPLGDVRNDPKA